MRVAGDAFQCFSVTTFSRSCAAGYCWISRRGFGSKGEQITIMRAQCLAVFFGLVAQFGWYLLSFEDRIGAYVPALHPAQSAATVCE